MKRVVTILIVSLFTGAACAQVPPTSSQAEPTKAEGTHPVKAGIKPEPDISATTPKDAKAETKKVEKPKKAKTQKKPVNSDTAAESRTGPVR